MHFQIQGRGLISFRQRINTQEMAVPFLDPKTHCVFSFTPKKVCVFIWTQEPMVLCFSDPKTDCVLPYRKSMLYFEIKTSFHLNPRTKLKACFSDQRNHFSLDPSTFQIQKKNNHDLFIVSLSSSRPKLSWPSRALKYEQKPPGCHVT